MTRLPLILLICITAACGTTQPTRSGVTVENLDRSVRPQDDFYRFVNGSWLKKTTIPDDKSNYGVFTALADKASKDVRAIIDRVSKPGQDGPEAKKIGALYRSMLNTEMLETLGTTPLKPWLDRIDAVKSKDDLAGLMASMRRVGMSAPLILYVSVDAKKTDQYAVYLTQGGLGLPDRDYYLDASERYTTIRAQYLAHVETMLKMAGLATDPAAAAATIMSLETDIARGQWTRVQRRDRDKTHNVQTIEELNVLAPGMDWGKVLAAAGMEATTSVVVRELSYIPAFAKLLVARPVEDWKTALRWTLLRETTEVLAPTLDDANFAFYGGVLTGVPQQKPRWERAVSLVNGVLGEAVGKLYVAEHFKPEAKERMVELVEMLRAAYKQSIVALPWMGDKTKKEALDKLAKFRPKIGYPDKWRDYSELEIREDDLFGNVTRGSAFGYDEKLAQLPGPVDRSEWFMTPQTVNAYYSPPRNEIVFPAAILQPPFFDLEADDAVNYGAIGAVIGHEMGHGFDDQGAKSDGDGVLRNWWTDEDLSQFKTRTAALVAQFNAFEVLGDAHVNGEFTLGENIGDLGGLNIAHRAYTLSLDGSDAPEMDGFTGDQRFFIGWAQCWPRLYRDTELRRRLVVDPHSPSEFRSNGPVRNMEAFVKAFDVKKGDKLWLDSDQRVRIW